MSRPLRTLALALVLLAAPALASCSAGAAVPPSAPPSTNATTTAPVSIDNCGTEITVGSTPPQRIVTVKSQALELLLALGAGDRIVGSAFSDGPLPHDLAAAGADIPVLSDKLPSKETVLALEPDLVFAGWESNFSVEGVGERDALQKLGITTYVAPAACKEKAYMPNPLTFDQVFAGFTEAGELVGEQDAAARLVAAQRAQLKAIVPDTHGLTAVWYSSGKDQPFVGAGIGAPEMIMSAAGLKNAFADVADSWTSTSWELVADANPDVIVLVDSAWNSAAQKIALLKANPVTAELDAVVHERFIVVDFPATEAGVRNVDAVESLVKQAGELR
ncbi:MAG: putative F420-0 ABC transporter substrate-binding protein [Microbacterium sp.]